MLIWVSSHFSASKYARLNIGGKRAAHLSENKGVKRECKKFGENSGQMLLFQRFVTSIVGPYYTGQPVEYEHLCNLLLLACVAGIERGRG